ncbi:MAG TPA: YidC/Oxa1 family membrane protein insertase [Chloroflexota bacterium]|nr:YidC/Oxa1 family membrane protein insertase [Chloroflexota bacterium]
MAAIGQLYNAMRDALAGPMMVALQFLYHSLGSLGVPSWGLTIILFTVVVKLIFWPLTLQQIRSSRAMQALQPELNELKKVHGKDKEKMMQEQMRLYKENRVNPMAGCLPMLIQLPIWIGLYQALFMLAQNPDFASRFLWIPNLAQPEGVPYLLAILSGASQFVVQRMMQVNSTDQQQQTMNQAMQFMPIMYIFIAFRMPAGLVLYWVASNVFTLIQQSFIYGWGSVLPGRRAPALATAAPRAIREPAQRSTVAASNGTTNGAAASTTVATTNAPRKAKKRRK